MTKIFSALIVPILSVYFSVSTICLAQAGSLDLSFGKGGKVLTAIGPQLNEARALAIQADGKIVAVGATENGPKDDFAIIRYNSNGSLDSTFDKDGIVTTVVGSSYDEATTVALQLDGKIIVAGYSYTGSNSDFALIRYNKNGSLDSSFGSFGKVITAIGTNGDFGLSVALQSDGKIIVAGYSENGLNDDFAIVRYTKGGLLDSTFDADGIVTTDIGKKDRGCAVKIQADGKIVVAGYSQDTSYSFITVVRYNANGSLDNTFDFDGKQTTVIGVFGDQARSLAVQSDGKIVVVGYSYGFAGSQDFAVVRYNINGSLDSSFDIDGKVTTAIGACDQNANAVVIQSDNKILLVGHSLNKSTSTNEFAIVRYNTNGSLDNTFDFDGIVTTPLIGKLNDVAYAVAIQADGKIVVAGSSANSSSDILTFFAVVRYNNNINLGIGAIHDQNSEVKISPNPFSIWTILESKIVLENATLHIYNSLGQQVMQMDKLFGRKIILHRDNLLSGIYSIRLIQNNELIDVKKIVVTE
jgi:uncharacterized delta-60 repeat protein